jgi:hypothetical protein
VEQFLKAFNLELYQVTNLDWFIYRYINYMAARLQDILHSREMHKNFILDLNEIKFMSLSLGEYFKNFLSQWCLGACSLKCPFKLKDRVNLKQQLQISQGERAHRMIQNLLSFLGEESKRENAFRVDIMNHVILDVLIDFYGKEFDTHVEEESLELIDLAESLENLTVEFLNTIELHLLEMPEDSAIYYFEQIQSEHHHSPSLFDFEDSSDDEGTDFLQDHSEPEEGLPSVIDDVLPMFYEFLDHELLDESLIITHHFKLFEEYLHQKNDILEIFDLSEFHLKEFMGIWLIDRLVFEDENQVMDVFNALAYFVNWLYHEFGLDLKKTFLSLYERSKLNTRRAIKAINNFYELHNMIENLILKTKFLDETKFGWYRIENIERLKNAYLDMRDIRTKERLTRVFLDKSVATYLEKGDYIQATFLKRGIHWSFLELNEIIPSYLKDFLEN